MAAAGILCLSGCEDERNNYMVDDLVSYVGNPEILNVSVLDEVHKVSVVKSGKGMTGAEVAVSVSEDILNRWNSDNGTGYSLLSSDYYALSSDSFSFSEKDVRKTFDISWDAAKLIPELKAGDKVLPLQLSSTGTAVDAKRDRIFIRPVLTSVTMDAVEAKAMSPSLDKERKDTVSATMSLSIPLKAKDLEIELAIDNSLVEAYNSAHGTSHQIAPEGTVYLKDPVVKFASGVSKVEFSYIFDCSKFYKDGKLIDFTSFIIPIAIKSFSIEGLEITEKALYVPVTPMVEKTLTGPWTVLEGMNQCYGNEPDRPGWAAKYLVDRMVDGDMTTEWISIWEHDNVFPMSFVFDMGDLHIFKKFKFRDHSTAQGNYQEYEIYMSEVYKGADTEWKLVAKGKRGYSWVSGGNTYDFPVQEEYPGRYLKFVIVKSEFPWTGDYAHGRGKLSEIYGEGL